MVKRKKRYNGLDKKDLKILKTLQEDSNLTNLELSKIVKLSPAPTLERRKKLERNRYIKSYHAEIDQQKLGIGIIAFMQISLERQKKNSMANFMEQLNEIDEVMECFQVTGQYDYILKLYIADIPSFDHLIKSKFSRIEEIRQMHTNIAVSIGKFSHVVPFDYELKEKGS